MKRTEAQKARRIKARLSFQKHCRHWNATFEPYGETRAKTWICDNCGKNLGKIIGSV